MYCRRCPERILNKYSGRRRQAALEDEARFDEAAQRLLQFGLGERHGRCQQLIEKVTPGGGARRHPATMHPAGPNISRAGERLHWNDFNTNGAARRSSSGGRLGGIDGGHAQSRERTR